MKFYPVEIDEMPSETSAKSYAYEWEILMRNQMLFAFGLPHELVYPANQKDSNEEQHQARPFVTSL